MPSEAGTRFSKEVTFTIDGKGSGITTTPAEIVARLGEPKACGRIGAPVTTQSGHYEISFKKNEGTGADYTELNNFHVEVTDKRGYIEINTGISCIPGCQATPILVAVATGEFPYSAEGVEVVIVKTDLDTDGATPSKGITLVTSSITLSLKNPSGLLSVSCAALPPTEVDPDTLFGVDGSVSFEYKFGAAGTEDNW